MQTLKGRTCVFAGATGRIGRGAVKALARGGMNVVMVTHNRKAAEEIVSSLTDAPGKVAAMSNEKGDAAILQETESLFGSVDVLISSTGGLLVPDSLGNITDALLDEKLHHQVTDVFHFVREALPFLRKSRAGRVIFTATAGALDGYAGEHMADSIARGAVLSMTQALARELLPEKITVNCIARSGLVSDMPDPRPGDLDTSVLADTLPMGRCGTPEEYGALAAYIASEESAYVTGHIFNLTGGLHIG